VAAYPRILETQFADGVILVGHSNSGVVALTMPTVAPDLMGGPSPFVRRIGTIDSPLQRLYTGQAELYVARIVAWKHAQGVHVQSLGNAAV
jgi:hypothetical protein